MEMDLAPFIGGIFDPLIFVFVTVLNSSGIFIWMFNKKDDSIPVSLKNLRQALARTWLDTGLVAGILGSTISMMGLMKDDSLELAALYATMPKALGAFLYGGLYTGLGYCLLRNDYQITYRIRPIGSILYLVLAIYVVSDLIPYTGIPAPEFFTNTKIIPYFLGPMLIILLLGLRRGESIPLAVNNANVVATLGGMAIGIVFWFVDGADYVESVDAIFFISNILVLGGCTYLIVYIWSLLEEVTDRGNYQTKSWHIAEAAAFFMFLVYAPVGATEYLRESTDQEALQAQHQAQRLEIDQLKAQIKLLTEKVGEV